MAIISDKEFVDHVETYRHEFYRYIMRNVWNPSAADDVFAGAVATAWESRKRFEAGTNFRAWMYRIITNKCYVVNREIQRSNINVDAIDETLYAVDPADNARSINDPVAFLGHVGDQIHDAIRQLSTAQRSCFLLLVLGKFSYKEISGILDIPIGTVMTHLARGRTRMRRLLTDYAKSKGIGLRAERKRIKRTGTDA